MGLRIGDIPSRLGSLTPSARTEPPKIVKAELRPLRAVNRDEARPNLFFDREKPEIVRAGFGEGTVSTPTAAIHALRGGLRSARRAVPSVEQTREQLRERLAEQREEGALRAEARREHLRRVEFRRPDPAAQARNFINQVDRAAGAALARANEEPPEPAANAARIQINGEAFDFTRRNEEPLFDVRV